MSEFAIAALTALGGIGVLAVLEIALDALMR
jgi:hypothetical protein